MSGGFTPFFPGHSPHADVMGTTPHKVDMVSGVPIDEQEVDNLRRDTALKRYSEAVVEAAQIQGELLGGGGQQVLAVIRAQYEARLEELASQDPQCVALQKILSDLGQKVRGAPAQFARKVRQYLGPEFAIPFDPATAESGPGTISPGGA